MCFFIVTCSGCVNEVCTEKVRETNIPSHSHLLCNVSVNLKKRRFFSRNIMPCALVAACVVMVNTRMDVRDSYLP